MTTLPRFFQAPTTLGDVIAFANVELVAGPFCPLSREEYFRDYKNRDREPPIDYLVWDKQTRFWYVRAEFAADEREICVPCYRCQLVSPEDVKVVLKTVGLDVENERAATFLAEVSDGLAADQLEASCTELTGCLLHYRFELLQTRAQEWTQGKKVLLGSSYSSPHIETAFAKALDVARSHEFGAAVLQELEQWFHNIIQKNCADPQNVQLPASVWDSRKVCMFPRKANRRRDIQGAKPSEDSDAAQSTESCLPIATGSDAESGCVSETGDRTVPQPGKLLGSEPEKQRRTESDNLPSETVSVCSNGTESDDEEAKLSRPNDVTPCYKEPEFLPEFAFAFAFHYQKHAKFEFFTAVCGHADPSFQPELDLAEVCQKLGVAFEAALLPHVLCWGLYELSKSSWSEAENATKWLTGRELKPEEVKGFAKNHDLPVRERTNIRARLPRNSTLKKWNDKKQLEQKNRQSSRTI